MPVSGIVMDAGDKLHGREADHRKAPSVPQVVKGCESAQISQEVGEATTL